MVAEDRLSNEEIAREIGITRQALDKWKIQPAFRSRVEELRETLRTAIIAEGIANRQNRVDALNDRWRRMQSVIDARAATPPPKAWHSDDGSESIDVPGWETGLLTEVVRKVGDVVEFRYEIDAMILKELRAHEEQAAKELGQWVEKSDRASDQPVIRVTVLSGVDGREADPRSLAATRGGGRALSAG